MSMRGRPDGTNGKKRICGMWVCPRAPGRGTGMRGLAYASRPVWLQGNGRDQGPRDFSLPFRVTASGSIAGLNAPLP
eukprot:2555194-Prymnesium_polylepis.1